MTNEREAHWDGVYGSKAPEAVSWHQETAATSLALIARAGLERDALILDVGGGASRLVDGLLAQGFTNVRVLDVSERALEHARARLGADAARVTWIRADITDCLSDGAHLEPDVRLWHDRAVFHFLTEAGDRAAYRALLHRTLVPGGHVVIATFALDGPERCSGLPVVRYAPEDLHEALGRDELSLEETVAEEHHTPAGNVQRFVFCRFTKRV